MSEKQNQPREYDAVLGSNAPPPVEGVVLGGLEGVKLRLTSVVVESQSEEVLRVIGDVY